MTAVPDFVRRAAEARPDAPPPADRLEAARTEARRLRDLYAELAELAERQANLEAQVNFIESKGLLDIMVEAGMPSFTLEAEGNHPPAEFKRATIVNAAIPKDREGEAFLFLDEEGEGELIRSTFKLDFGMGERKQADRLEALLKKNKYEFTRKVGVLSASLTAAVKRRLAAGKVVPNDILGVYVGEKVEVTLGGEKLKRRKT